MAEQPDLIVLGGDYVTWGGDHRATGDRYFVEPAADAVRGVVGAARRVRRTRQSRRRSRHAGRDGRPGRRDPEGRAHAPDRSGARPSISSGIRYWTTRSRDIAAVARGAAKASILLAHNPSRLKEAAALSLPLMLSGHTHGGQIVLPGLGAVAARNFPIISGVGATRPHNGVRKPRRRNGLRAYSDQLPARGRGPHAQTRPTWPNSRRLTAERHRSMVLSIQNMELYMSNTHLTAKTSRSLVSH